MSNQPQSFKITPTVTDVFHFCTICCYYQNKWTGNAISKGAKYLLVWAINNILCKGSFKYQLTLLFAIFGPPTPHPWQSAYLEKILNSKKSPPTPYPRITCFHTIQRKKFQAKVFDLIFLLKKSKLWIIYPYNYNCVLLLSLNHVIFSVFPPFFHTSAPALTSTPYLRGVWPFGQTPRQVIPPNRSMTLWQTHPPSPWQSAYIYLPSLYPPYRIHFFNPMFL